MIVIPDADQSPEQLAGLATAFPPSRRRRAGWPKRQGFHVILPAIVDRAVAPRNGRARLAESESLYRSSFELGRHLIGYEVQKVLALLDALRRTIKEANRRRGFRLWRGRDDRVVRRCSRSSDLRRVRERFLAIAATSGGSRSTGMYSGCWISSATPRLRA